MNGGSLLRISLKPEQAGEVRLILEGEIANEWVQVLEQQCLGLIEQRRWVALDFKNVTSVDRQGIRMLRRLSSSPCRFVECSPVITDLLEQG